MNNSVHLAIQLDFLRSCKWRVASSSFSDAALACWTASTCLLFSNSFSTQWRFRTLMGEALRSTNSNCSTVASRQKAIRTTSEGQCPVQRSWYVWSNSLRSMSGLFLALLCCAALLPLCIALVDLYLGDRDDALGEVEEAAGFGLVFHNLIRLKSTDRIVSNFINVCSRVSTEIGCDRNFISENIAIAHDHSNHNITSLDLFFKAICAKLATSIGILRSGYKFNPSRIVGHNSYWFVIWRSIRVWIGRSFFWVKYPKHSGVESWGVGSVLNISRDYQRFVVGTRCKQYLRIGTHPGSVSDDSRFSIQSIRREVCPQC